MKPGREKEKKNRKTGDENRQEGRKVSSGLKGNRLRNTRD